MSGNPMPPPSGGSDNLKKLQLLKRLGIAGLIGAPLAVGGYAGYKALKDDEEEEDEEEEEEEESSRRKR